MALAFQKRYLELREAENAKNVLLEDMLHEINNLNLELKETKENLEREKDSSKLFYLRYKQNDDTLERIRKENDDNLKRIETSLNSNSFVSVLIDGDCMNFLDELIKGAEAGGQEAAQLLRRAVIEYIRTQVPDLENNYEIVVQVYSNIRGLVKAYSDANVISHRDDLDRFIRGFNMSYPLFSIIDAGNGKECSDAKLKEVFKMYISTVQCKHIIFGGSSDNGYARFLGPLSGEAEKRQRITMLEGPPFAMELLRLTDKFKTTVYPTVFRDSKIEAVAPRPISQYRGAKAEHLPDESFQSPIPLHIKYTGPSPSYGSSPQKSTNDSSYPPLPQPSAVQFPNLSSPAPSKGYGSPAASTKKEPSATTNDANSVELPDGFIAVNSKGERVDPPLKPSSVVVSSIKPRKMCNHYHLRKSCHNPTCTYEHGEPLEGQEKDALKFLARQFPCENEIYCEDGWCMFGHRCIAGSKCVKQYCRFSDEMHGIDEKIVSSYEGEAGRGF